MQYVIGAMVGAVIFATAFVWGYRCGEGEKKKRPTEKQQPEDKAAEDKAQREKKQREYEEQFDRMLQYNGEDNTR
ncbi:MAG: hypothetical protein IJP98_02320 [Clostridia bacterium]|nr:hypothetical protein [Clostridia bacterium]